MKAFYKTSLFNKINQILFQFKVENVNPHGYEEFISHSLVKAGPFFHLFISLELGPSTKSRVPNCKNESFHHLALFESRLVLPVERRSCNRVRVGGGGGPPKNHMEIMRV